MRKSQKKPKRPRRISYFALLRRLERNSSDSEVRKLAETCRVLFAEVERYLNKHVAG
jgi:hypothetical protein